MSGRLLESMREADRVDVLALNDRFQHLTAPLDLDGLLRLEAAGTVEVIRAAGGFAGFVVTLPDDAAHDSANLAWFRERFEGFVYLDRIIVHEDFHRQGLARRTYDEVEERTARRTPLLTLEVNTDPPNEPSLAFHAARGFEQVGERLIEDHTVAMMVKRLR
ncbi:GNAT family N-acetyltransferase [Nocardioides sp. GXQ0305]|uniref:GNAT family N-acetyltransferase n=1 Tax=Nocardioides sp. GXQ0305 TaxID=3423912 RepID=UPI003D7E6795